MRLQSLIVRSARALAAPHLVAHMLFGLSANDPAAPAVVAFFLLNLAALAGYVQRAALCACIP